MRNHKRYTFLDPNLVVQNNPANDRPNSISPYDVYTPPLATLSWDHWIESVAFRQNPHPMANLSISIALDCLSRLSIVSRNDRNPPRICASVDLVRCYRLDSWWDRFSHRQNHEQTIQVSISLCWGISRRRIRWRVVLVSIGPKTVIQDYVKFVFFSSTMLSIQFISLQFIKKKQLKKLSKSLNRNMFLYWIKSKQFLKKRVFIITVKAFLRVQ